MRLDMLAEGLRHNLTGDPAGTEIRGLSRDSRTISEGELFFAIKGEHFDGNEFIDEVIKKGASAVVYESPPPSELTVPYLQVEDINLAMAWMADRFYGHPSGRLQVTGVTGTNGKTTITYILDHILRLAGKKTGVIGTIRYKIGDNQLKAVMTTPDALDFQRLLSDMVNEGVTHVVSEVSSHSLSLRRIDFTDFHTSVFTNLTRDHLDFHGDMEDYYTAKRRLFLELAGSAAIINTDDPYGKRLLSELRSSRPELSILTYGLGADADLRAEEIDESFDGLRFNLLYSGRSTRIKTGLIGQTNLYNILAAVGAAVKLGIGWQKVIEGVKTFEGVEGRMEPLRPVKDLLVIIDYAHTPDALAKVIQTLRRLTENRIITVFGCGGDRDRGKRPLMGDISERLSDMTIITSDNPRGEDPEDIIKDVVGGIGEGEYIVEPDRREAIHMAVQMAAKGDVVIVAGKGHEEYQEIRGVRYPFSDKEVIREALKRRSAGDDEPLNRPPSFISSKHIQL
jgi:UDP-N-acetylmuramoyl-L-alanyl-D-glutamate--2,6-diaminopimelate ligase